MNLQNQTVTGTDQVTVQDSLNAALLELLINLRANSVAPNTTDLIIYVDNQPKTNPSSERKEYLFELSDILRTYSGVSDEFSQKLEVVNNDIVLKSIITRNISYDETTQTSSVLQTPEVEELESYPITLFDGVNYIYTNYSNTDIELIYVKDTAENRVLLTGSMYYNHKLKNDGEFCLDDIYFKDAFTKTGDDLNIEVNNASVDSIDSNNNAFSLDENGNLVVNTITCNSINGGSGSGIDAEAICDLIYPIGSIYLSVNNVSPATLFGGTWEKIQNRFLLGDGSLYTLGATGGEASVTLSLTEIPSHNHSGTTESNGAHTHNVKGLNGTSSGSGACLESYPRNAPSTRTVSNAAMSNGAHTHDFTTENSGGGQAHNNMPPYLVVSMWKRTA